MSRLTERQIAIRDMTREFVRKEVSPFAAQWDRDATVPLETLRKIGALGLFGVCIPEQWGGSGADFTSYALATEELAAMATQACATWSAPATPFTASKFADFGTLEQKSATCGRWRAAAISGCMLLTEPAGSDARQSAHPLHAPRRPFRDQWHQVADNVGALCRFRDGDRGDRS
jgi:alkylation response protein AidB-like acyl-CoA dehydrogenase